MKYKNFIWDFGGTIINSYPALVKGILKALSDIGIEETYDEVFEQARISKNHLAKYFMNKHNLDYDFVTKIKMAENLVDPESRIPFEGVEEILSFIKENGGKNYIFTHRNRDSANELLIKHDLEKYFEIMIAKENELARKPSPEGILFLMHTQKLDPSETVNIGDRGIDVEAGLKAGIDNIYFNPEGVIVEKATYNIKAFKEIFEILKR
jgi:HAD superfamily hydrolase (TIGR01549 family)